MVVSLQVSFAMWINRAIIPVTARNCAFYPSGTAIPNSKTNGVAHSSGKKKDMSISNFESLRAGKRSFWPQACHDRREYPLLLSGVVASALQRSNLPL